MYEFLDATITKQTSPEEAFRRFNTMATQHTETLRKYSMQVQKARQQQDDDAVQRAANLHDEALEQCVRTLSCAAIVTVTRHACSSPSPPSSPRYIPVLMSQARIYWDLKNYAQVEKVPSARGSLWPLPVPCPPHSHVPPPLLSRDRSSGSRSSSATTRTCGS